AFAAQVIACQRALDEDTFCRTELGRDSRVGEIPLARLNPDGGGISLGHPVGASGARIVLHLLTRLEWNRADQGVASLCIGGGQGGAMRIERLSGEE
ncbi:MAG: acetyl-CoA C-acyltransferase, partial [Magnetococcales bacterium]|nr:acetyl-CoA C-acyltransferase [Magnetococcales bacterium]